VTLLAFYDPWVQVSWATAQGAQRGWITLQWLDLRGPIPPAIVTPAP
jgi:hypothetical protein